MLGIILLLISTEVEITPPSSPFWRFSSPSLWPREQPRPFRPEESFPTQNCLPYPCDCMKPGGCWSLALYIWLHPVQAQLRPSFSAAVKSPPHNSCSCCASSVAWSCVILGKGSEISLCSNSAALCRDVVLHPPGRLTSLVGPSGPLSSQAPEEMKPYVTYQQLKTLHSPEDPPPTGPPNPAWSKNSCCILVTVILSAMLLAAVGVHLLFLPYPGPASAGEAAPGGGFLDNPCSDPCRSTLVESIPEGMTFDDNDTLLPSTFAAWSQLLREAQRSLDIASFYWTLRNEDTHTQEPSAGPGEEILAQLLKAPSRGIALRIAVNPPSSRMPSTDLQDLEESGAQIRKINLPRLTQGILHTKFWIVDQTHLYLGSANMDWRALTQVKELGVVVYNCSCLAQDLSKMFNLYWSLGLPNATIPSPWPAEYSTTYNKETPLELTLNNTEAGVYFSSAPPALCASGRTEDLQALLSVIEGAREFVYIAVMNYLPTMEFSHPKRFWPVIDDHLRKVAYERRVRVRLLIGCWKHSKAEMFPFLKSLVAVKDDRTHLSVEVRLFIVPANETQARIPYARVNHSKFMVTDTVAYIGTSNWSGDYFVRTAGSALVVNQSHVEPGGEPTIRDQLQDVFERDWESRYTHELYSLEQWQDLCSPH